MLPLGTIASRVTTALSTERATDMTYHRSNHHQGAGHRHALARPEPQRV
jgi:hypothetical protein